VKIPHTLAILIQIMLLRFLTNAKTLFQTRNKERRSSENILTDRPNYEVSDQCYRILQANAPPIIYVHGGMLVRLSSNKYHRLQIQGMAVDILRSILDRCFKFVRLTAKGEVNVSPPPADLVKDFLSRSRWAFPPLDGIITCPTLRSDGSLLVDEGYDPITHLFYKPSEGLEGIRVPLEPSPVQVRSAITPVEELIVDFRSSMAPPGQIH